MTHVKDFNGFLNENMGKGPRRNKFFGDSGGYSYKDPTEMAAIAVFKAMDAIELWYGWYPDQEPPYDMEIPGSEVPVEWKDAWNKLKDASKIVDTETGTGIRSRQDYDLVRQALENYVDLLEERVERETKEQGFDEGEFAINEYDDAAYDSSLRALDLLDGMGAKF